MLDLGRESPSLIERDGPSTRGGSKTSFVRQCGRSPAPAERSNSTSAGRSDPGSPSGGAKQAVRQSRLPATHYPDRLGGNFYEAMAMAEHFGFHPGRRP